MERSAVLELRRAELLLAAGRYAEALRRAQELIARLPGEELPFVLAARAELGLQRYEDAQRSAEAAIGLEPSLAVAHRVRALALTAQARKARARSSSAAKAENAGREAVRLAPDAAPGYWVLADALLVGRHIREAISVIDHAVELAPDHPESWRFRSRAARQARDHLVAEADCREALRLDPENASAANELGVVMKARGRSAMSLQQFVGALALDPSSDSARRNLINYGRKYVYFAVLILLCPMAIFWPLWFVCSNGLTIGLFRWDWSKPRAERCSIAIALWMSRRRPDSGRRRSVAPGTAIVYYRIRTFWLGLFVVFAGAVIAVVIAMGATSQGGWPAVSWIVVGAVGAGVSAAGVVWWKRVHRLGARADAVTIRDTAAIS
jgi:tetratricopeptide (TPR) repeat protein